MENYIITNIEKNVYTLKNTATDISVKKRITFYHLEKDVAVGDTISMHKELLDPTYAEYDLHYYFGGIDEPYGRKITSADSIDVICVQQADKNTVLKRFFG